MSKPEWGVKRTCPSCSARFYDMCRQPIVCPKCSNAFEPDAFVKKRRGRPPAVEAKSLSKPTAEGNIELEIAEDMPSLEETDEVLEDTSDFGEEEVVGVEATSEDD